MCAWCSSGRTKKFGRQLGRQRYRCHECGRTFQEARKLGRLRRSILAAYVWNRQTAPDLAETTGKSERWVRKQIDAVETPEQSLVPEATPIAADMTFWGRSYGVCVMRSPSMKKNLWWTESQFETPWVYKEGLDNLLAEGWIFTGAVIDGKRGVAQIFEARGIPVQYCQFHQAKTVTKHLTRRPKTPAAKELRALALILPKVTEEGFKRLLTEWHRRYQSFLEEKSPASNRRRGWDYTHKRLRAAYRSLKTNLPRLFTYLKYPDGHIPNTTNTLDGMFSQIKNRLAVHRGLRRDRRYKIITTILQGKEKNSN